MPKFTKTPPEVIAAFEAARPDRPDVAKKTMFGYPALFLRGNMFAFTFGPKVAVRLGGAKNVKATKAGAEPFEIMPGRPMLEYVTVPASALKGPALKKWLNDALAYADTLPAKGSKSAPTRTPKRSPAKAAAKATATKVGKKR